MGEPAARLDLQGARRAHTQDRPGERVAAVREDQQRPGAVEARQQLLADRRAEHSAGKRRVPVGRVPRPDGEYLCPLPRRPLPPEDGLGRRLGRGYTQGLGERLEGRALEEGREQYNEEDDVEEVEA